MKMQQPMTPATVRRSKFPKDTTLVSRLYARIYELEAANAVCRRDIEALMRSADSLEARNTELEAERDRLKAIIERYGAALSDPSGE